VRGPHHPGDADARRDGGGQPYDRVVRRLCPQGAGQLGGLLGGWLYWYFWVIVVDYRPLRALQAAIAQFHPDQVVVAALPASESVWQRFDVVDRCRALGIPVTHVEAKSLAGSVLG